MKKNTNWRFYYCPYILRTGEVCNQPCYHPDEYKVHRNFRQVSCKECGQMTRSEYEFCDEHAKKYRVKEYYNQKKLVKLASMQVVVGNLEVKK